MRATLSAYSSRVHGVDARSGAEADVVVEAGAAAADAVVVGDPLPLVAGRSADRHDAAHGVDRLARRARVGVRAEVARARLVLLARELDRRKRVAQRQRDERVASCRPGSRRCRAGETAG